MTQVFAQAVLIVSQHTLHFPTGCLTVAMCSAVNTGDWVCLHAHCVPDMNVCDGGGPGSDSQISLHAQVNRIF